MAANFALWATLLATAYFGSILFWIALSHLRFARYHRRAGSRYPPLGAAGWAAFYARTVLSILRLSLWWALAPSGRPIPARGPVAAGELPEIVLCIHGFHMDESCFWGLRRRLARRGWVSVATDLGLPYRRAEVYAAALRRDLAAIASAFPVARIDVVAHSMGGLILRQVLGESPALAARLRRVVTLATPHHGTALLGWFRRGPVFRMMSRESPYVRGLPSFADAAPAAEVITVASAHDLLVYPVECAHVEDSRRIDLEGVGHLGLLTDRAVHDWVARVLAEGSARGAREAGHGAAEQQDAEQGERQ